MATMIDNAFAVFVLNRFYFLAHATLKIFCFHFFIFLSLHPLKLAPGDAKQLPNWEYSG
jgi:hypothetical protein